MAATFTARRTALQQLFLTLTLPVGLSYAQGSATITQPHSLTDAAMQAATHDAPLIVMVTLRGCPWCDFVRTSHLKPLVRKRGMTVLEIDMANDVLQVRDFQQSQTTQKALAMQWGVKRAPTLLFLNSAGAEVAQRLVGVSSQDYYGVYLDQRIETARQSILSTQRKQP